jgi:hypothetical protein
MISTHIEKVTLFRVIITLPQIKTIQQQQQQQQKKERKERKKVSYTFSFQNMT